MSDTREQAIFVAVIRAVQAGIKAKPVYQPGGGNVMWWPLVAKVLTYLNPDRQAIHPKALAKKYKRLRQRETPESLDAMAASVDYPYFREAVRQVLGEGEPAESPADKSPLPTVETPDSIEYSDLKLPVEPGWSFDFMRKVVAVQKDMQALDTTQAKAHARIDTDLPVGIVFAGDYHVGGRGTDHERLLDDFAMWKALFPAVRVVGMGDYGEMFSGKMARIGIHQHVMTIDMQVETVMDLFTNPNMRDLWLTFLKGNHDGWAGPELSNYVMRMAQKCGVPFLGLGGELYLTVGKVEYKLAVWHRYPGQSALNRGNNQRRVRIDHNGADVVALAHLHNAYVEFGQTGDCNHVGLRCGAYKVTDEHARDAAGNVVADLRMPMVICNPRVKDLLYFEDFRKGVEILLRLRREWSNHPSFQTDSSRLQTLLVR